MSARITLRKSGIAASVFLGAATLWCTLYFWPGAAPEREIARFLRARASGGELVVVTPALSLDRLRAYTRVGLFALSAADERVAAKSGFSRIWLVGPLATGVPPPTALGVHVAERHVVAGTAVWLVTRDAEASPDVWRAP